MRGSKYVIRLPDGSEVNFTGTLANFMKSYTDKFGEFTEGKRKAFQNTLKRGSFYRGFTIVSVNPINKEVDVEEHSVEKEEIPVSNGNGMFILKSKSRNVEISIDIVRQMLQLYCTRRLTLEETANQLGLLREEVKFVLRRFKIIKDSIPFIQEDIDSMTSDEMTELVRLEKKRGFKRKLDNSKHIDQEKELKKLHTKQYYFDRFVDAMKDVRSLEVITHAVDIPKANKKTTIVATLTDEHFGSKIDSPFNKFNKDIAKERMNAFTKAIIDKANTVQAERVVVEQLGDYIEGVIHVSGRIGTDMNAVESCKFSAEVVAKMLLEIRLNTNAEVELYSCHGNHDRIVEGKTESLEEENFERFIVWGIDLIIKNSRVKGIKVVTENMIFGMTIIPMYGRYIVGSHGHNIKRQENVVIVLGRKGYNVLQYHQGHFHNLKIETKGETVVITSPSFVGSNSYATKMFLVSNPQQLIHTYNENGWVGMDIVELG